MSATRITMGFLLAALLCAPLLSQNPPLVAEKIMTIGPGAADGPYLFSRIAAVRTDASGNIYVLSTFRAGIAKFNPRGEFASTIGKPLFDFASQKEQTNYLNGHEDFARAKFLSSRTTGELYAPRAFYLDEKRIIVTDIRRLVLYDAQGNLRRVANLDRDSYEQAAFPNAQGELVFLGPDAGGSLFHVLDEKGQIVRSYGDKFAMPPEVAEKISGDLKEAETRMISRPISFSLGPEGKVLLLSPFSYEIRIYRGERLWKTLTGRPPYSSGFAGFTYPNVGGKPAGLITNYIAEPVLLEKDGLILVFQAKSRSETSSAAPQSFRVDVFKDYEYANSFELALDGYPNYLGSNGRLFTVGSSLKPFVNEYVIKGLPGI
jgi:hypothetical protein